MKLISLFAVLLFINSAFAQTIIESKQFGRLEFVEIKYGVAQVVRGSREEMKNSPTGSHGWLSEFGIIKITDSVPAELKANFGVQYMVKARDTVDIEVEIEWIFPKKMVNDEGKKFKSIKYKTQRPTNIESASSYSLDKPFEILKGDWIMNIYIEHKLVHTKKFVLY
jgi:Domain of unknown function (DUF3859)